MENNNNNQDKLSEKEENVKTLDLGDILNALVALKDKNNSDNYSNLFQKLVNSQDSKSNKNKEDQKFDTLAQELNELKAKTEEMKVQIDKLLEKNK